MSGDNQHFIPEFFLRGFKVPNLPGGKQSWVYKSQGEPELKYLSEIASDFHFYSPPDPGSLDETITRYENRLAAKVKALKKTPLGQIADANIPAEIIAHLSIRTDSMRATMSYGAKQVALGAFTIFSEHESIRRLFGLDGDAPNEMLKKLIAETQQQYASQIAQAGLTPEAFERVFYGLMKERFPQTVGDMRMLAAAFATRMYGEAETIGPKAQRRALSQGLVPEPRQAFLARLQWEVIAASGDAVLPDCVAIAFASDGQPKPIIFSDKDEIAAVVMPLDRRRLLVGRKSPEINVPPFMFNLHAISCSEHFFISSIRSAELETSAQYIGVMSKTAVHKEVGDAFADYKLPQTPPNPANHQTSFSYTAHFSGTFDADTVHQVNEAVKAGITWVAKEFSLDRIDHVTLSNDVRGAIASIDRGFEPSGANPAALPDNLLSKAITVLEGDQVHAHIILDEQVGLGLLSEDKEMFAGSMYVLTKELAEANAAIEFDKAFPGVMLRPHASLFDAIRYEQVSAAWTGYMATRFSARFWPQGRVSRKNLFIGAIAQAKQDIPELAKQFFRDGNHSELLRNILPYIEAILRHGACYAGLSDGLDEDTVADEEIQAALRSANLAEWYPSFLADLRSIWDRRGRWHTAKEFIGLSRHAERILWQCGVVLAPGPGGDCRIEFPRLAALNRTEAH